MSEQLQVCVIGLGRMGGRMADHIIGAGHPTRVFDLAADAMAPRVALGATAGASPADAARGCGSVHLVVFDDAQASEVIGGADGVLQTLEPGAVISVHTTVRPETIRTLAATAERSGVILLDAGISGGETGAAAGTLLTMVGGPADAVERVRPALDAFSKEVLHAGPLGTGMALKLARNATSFAMMATVYEALVLAHGAGVDPGMLRHALSSTGLFEQALVPLGFGPPGPLPADASPALRETLEHAVRMAEKDLEQALELATELGVTADLFARSRTMFHDVMRV